ncbi:hypothetical protein K523DRAFT_357948 [Schizophyllum commune Tattone D]|nr:hypothetical protein K523DRAFT_357948 [Schizophyllum commune Tattone D]
MKLLDFKPGSLVLVRNTRIEKSHSDKLAPRYHSPMVVIRRTTGGSYILAELNGTVFQNKIGAFWVLPYRSQTSIVLPENIHDLIDLSPVELDELLRSQEPVDAEAAEVGPEELAGLDDDVLAEITEKMPERPVMDISFPEESALQGSTSEVAAPRASPPAGDDSAVAGGHKGGDPFEEALPEEPDQDPSSDPEAGAPRRSNRKARPGLEMREKGGRDAILKRLK